MLGECVGLSGESLGLLDKRVGLFRERVAAFDRDFDLVAGRMLAFCESCPIPSESFSQLAALCLYGTLQLGMFSSVLVPSCSTVRFPCRLERFALLAKTLNR